ncbi:hypothetical protein FKW77_007990 [Venturia effusa]|uniref:PWWP domain-containing protein n=1 Tax=Venturia effusa TaxID=50376 RepID=A0A517LBA1_9PEZI|nr:hypothetical protein FKW77_007990 [Venturia effusa]
MSDTVVSPAPARDETAHNAENGVSAPSANGASGEATAKPVANGVKDEAETVIAAASTDVAPVAPTNGTTSGSKKEKRKSSGGVPEHKKKNLARKKSMPDLHLDVQPGQYWYSMMKGFKPWPSVICDEEMLPESLLMKRPVSAMRPDGTYREDFMEGGKQVRDRRYPVMFLYTNEFAWQVNTELKPLDMDELKEIVANRSPGDKKFSKDLWGAYEVAAEEHDLAFFKGMLVEHEKNIIQSREEEELKAHKKAEVAEKKAKRKSTGTTAAADAEGDVTMEDAASEDVPKKPKKTPKRKAEKEVEADEEEKGTTKTPKRLKIKASAPAEPSTDSAVKEKKAPKAKKPKAEKKETPKPAKPVEPEMTPQEKMDKKQKTILFLRHKLQKGFLSRDQTPKAEDMAQMHDNLGQLEQHPELETSIIKATKINKVLKGVLKLTDIPREDEFHFKSRCTALLNKWNAAMSADDAAPVESAATNGVSHDENAKPESVVPSVEKAPTPAAIPDPEAKAESEAKSNEAKTEEPMEAAAAPAEAEVVETN